MAYKITRFEITKLHGYQNINIPIKDNTIVLIGVNGIGKTTVVNLIYFFLTKQWMRILEYSFADISIVLDKKRLKINRKSLESVIEERHKRRSLHKRRYPQGFLYKKIQQHSFYSKLTKSKNSKQQMALAHKISRDLRVEYPEIANTIRINTNLQIPLFDFWEDEESRTAADHLGRIEEILQNKIDGPILYLPTYRRIEQDLERIYPGLENKIDEFRKKKYWRDDDERGFIEFVEFGMQDVEKMLHSLLYELKDNAITQHNNFAGGYLRDVLRDEAEAYEESLINKLNKDSIRRILNRVETLTDSEKDELMASLIKIKTSKKEGLKIKSRDKLLAHFFSKLYAINKVLKKKEQPCRAFVDVANNYLTYKNINYDDINYKMQIVNKKGHEISLSMLSSGEKQIVSLFAHLYLSDRASCSVIIDEPELSLSVEWQKTFLPDMLASNKCTFVAAVTHSPFIYDNELEPYTVDLQEFIK